MKHIHFKSIDSTHLYAKRSIDRLKAFPLTIITTDYQTSGIGRRLDKWHSPEGSSLLMSIVYKLPKSKDIPYTSQAAAAALKETLAPLNLPITFKYPNDLLIKGKKLSGIISETCHPMMITSIGLNLTQTPDQLALIDQPATSLLIETSLTFTPDQILSRFLSIFFASRGLGSKSLSDFCVHAKMD